MSRVVILMSIKPYFAERILSGVKRFELRRKVAEIPEFSRIIIYASAPVKAIVGEFYAGRVFRGSPEEVWRFVQSFPDSGVEEKDWPYIKGAREALAIEVLRPRRYKRPLTLEFLRRAIPDFVPPISYRRLHPGEELLKLINRVAYLQ